MRTVSRIRVAICSMMLACIGTLSVTLTAHAEGDARRGKVLAYTCHGCHGVPDYKNAFPNYSVPKLGGQNEQYLISALNGYAGGDRCLPAGGYSFVSAEVVSAAPSFVFAGVKAIERVSVGDMTYHHLRPRHLSEEIGKVSLNRSSFALKEAQPSAEEVVLALHVDRKRHGVLTMLELGVGHRFEYGYDLGHVVDVGAVCITCRADEHLHKVPRRFALRLVVAKDHVTWVGGFGHDQFPFTAVWGLSMSQARTMPRSMTASASR